MKKFLKISKLVLKILLIIICFIPLITYFILEAIVVKIVDLIKELFKQKDKPII